MVLNEETWKRNNFQLYYQGEDMFIDLLRSRRSIRRFEDRPVEKEKIDMLMEAALRSPSSRGFNPWEFVVVTEPDLIARLSKAKPHGASFLKNAPLAVVVCADPERSDVWVEDASIAAIILHLAATDLGLGSCWIQIRLREHDAQQSAQEYIAGLLGLKKGIAVESIMAIGYPKEEKPGHPKSSLLFDKVRFAEGD
jgi:nitroreductase